MVEESIHRTSCSSSQTFPSFRFIRRMRWWSKMNSLRSIPVLLFLQTCHPTRQSTLPDSLHFGYFGIMQVIQHGRYTQQQVPMCSDVFVQCFFDWMFYGYVWESEETINRSSSCTLLVLISIMVEECFAIPTTMLRWREHAPSSLHRQHPRRHDIMNQDDIITMYFPPYSNF